MKGKLRTTIRLTVVSVCVLATLLTAAFATGLQYYFGQSMARDAAANLYATAAAGVAAELRSVARVNSNVINLLANNTLLLAHDEQQEQLAALTELLARNPLYYAAYVGTQDGYLFEIINLEADAQARQALGAKPGDRWLKIIVEPGAGPSTRHLHYLDDQLQQRHYSSETTDYEVASRPWYRGALAARDATVTPPYFFAQTGLPGRTFSQRVADTDTVVAFDMTMTSISQFLRDARASGHGHIYLFNSDGEVFGSSEMASGGKPLESSLLPVNDLLEFARNGMAEQRLVETDVNGQAHFAYVQEVGDGRNPIYMGVLSPRAPLDAPYLEKLQVSIGATTLFLLLLLPLSWFIANPIVKPVKQLARENYKVQRREYDKVARVQTHVQELSDLSDSMVDMVASIQAHEQAQRDLMDAIIKVIAEAIDDKSSYTGGHCERVPELAMMLADAASGSEQAPFAEFRLDTDDQWREYQIAAWLHDCGKITTPEHIVDKGSKLETIYNRIHEVRMRFEVLLRDAEIDYWCAAAQQPEREAELRSNLEKRKQQLQEDYEFVAECNVGGEFLDEDKIQRLHRIAGTTWQRHFSNRVGLSPLEELRLDDTPETLPSTEPLLSDKAEHILEREQSTQYPPELAIDMDIPTHLSNLGELYNLSISRGTLTTEDRFRINEHMISTIKMLERLPFPEELKNVPRYASTHHETLKGTGYPRRLPGEALSIPERILAIADIFEALTASDRPYKKAKPLSVAVDIMSKMVADNHIDRDCFELFLTSGTYLRYAQAYLEQEQIDEVDIGRYVQQQAA